MRWSLLLTFACVPALASAQEMDLFGFNPRATAMANVQAASDGDFTAAYYNPALVHGATFGVGYTYQQPFFSVKELSAPQPGVTPGTHQLTDSEGVTFGFSVPLGGVFARRVSLAFGGYIPQDDLYRVRLFDDDSAVYYRYQNAPNQFQLVAAVSAQPWDWLSLGVGAQLYGNVGGSATFSAHLATNAESTPGYIKTSELESNTFGAASPLAGVAVGPFHGFEASFAWRGKAVGSYTLPISVTLDQGTGTLTVAVTGIYHFTPDEFSLGLSQKLLHGKLLLAAGLDYELWSEAPPQIALIGVNLPAALASFYNAQIVAQTSTGAPFDFLDTFVPRVGAEWKPLERLSVRAGYYYRPTVVPNQGANALFLDADTHVLSAGVGYAFDDPLKLANRLSVEAAVQLALVTNRSQSMDNEVGKLTYQTGGFTLDTPVALRYDF